jgi:hypothetical protein
MGDQEILRCRTLGIPLGSRLHFRWLYGMAKWLLVLNLLDGVFTLIWVEHFGAEELNVLLADLVYDAPLMFMVVKLALVSLGTLFLWRNRNNFLAVTSLFVAFFGYYLVFLLHLRYSSILFL